MTTNEEFTIEEKIAKLEQKIFFLESRISMLESNAIGYPIPYLENNMSTTSDNLNINPVRLVTNAITK